MKRRVGRPKKDNPKTEGARVYLTESEHERIVNIASAHHTTKSEMMNHICLEFLKSEQKDKILREVKRLRCQRRANDKHTISVSVTFTKKDYAELGGIAFDNDISISALIRSLCMLMRKEVTC